MPSRDVYFYAGSTDLDVIERYFMEQRGGGAPPSPEIEDFVEALRGRLVDSGLREEHAFEPAAGLNPPDTEGLGLYVGFEESGEESIKAQMVAFQLARETNVGTFDTMEESDGWDSTQHYVEQLRRGEI